MSSNTATKRREKKFVQVPTCVLKALNRTSVDLFLRHDADEPFVLYRDAGFPLTQDRASDLVQKCEEALYIRSCDYTRFSEDLCGVLPETIDQESLSASERYELLQYAVALEVEQSLRMVNCDNFVANAKTIGRQITTVLDESNILPTDLYRIVRHDFHTFVHVTNVAAYATLLAKQLGISDRTELERIATGSLLHDIGKRHIHQSLLTKTDALTKKEWATIRRHPQRGYEELYRRASLVEGQLMMVYQHHEHVNGHGYPVGILGDEIHPWAKLLAVVDVFDALTGDRPYRTPATRQQAIEFLTSRAGTQFDEEMVGCWTSAMQPN